MDNQQQDLTQEQSEKLTTASEQWSGPVAVARALGDFESAANYRQQNHDTNFKKADELLQAWNPVNTWEGTRKPRANMKVFLLYSQIEAMLPQVIGNLLADDPPFGGDPMPGTSLDQARIIVQLLLQQLRDLDASPATVKLCTASLRDLLISVYRSDLLYGNGIIEWGWIKQQVQRIVWERSQVPEKALTTLMGQTFMAPTGRMLPGEAQGTSQSVIISKPFAVFTDIRDFYIDPNATSSIVQSGRYCATRHWKTIYELDDMRSIEGFSVPTLEELKTIVQEKKSAESDNDKANAESYRGNSYNPSRDYTSDIGQKRIELIRYFTPTRCVYILNRDKKRDPMYNAENKYGVQPFLGSCYTEVLGRFHGMSMAQLVECDQKLAQELLNARLDELNLMVHPPMIKKKGISLPESAKRMVPGRFWELESVDDIKRMEMGNVTAQAFVEYEAMDRRVQKTTGNSDLSVLGTSSAGGNSANRTAAGINTQAAASGIRIKFQVENLEDRLMVPLLYAFLYLNKLFLDPNELLQMIGADGAPQQVDPLMILNAEVRLLMNASNKMKARAALANGGLQAILQFYGNPAFADQLSQVGRTPDFDAIDGLFCDTMGLPSRSLTKAIDPQTMQRIQQQKMGPDMIRMQMQRERIAGQQQGQESKAETELLRTILPLILTKETAHSILKQLGMDEPMTITQQEAAPAPSAGA